MKIFVAQSGLSRSLHMYISDDISFFKYEMAATASPMLLIFNRV